MLTRLLTRRLGVVGLALTAYDVWRFLPARHKRLLIQQGRGAATTLAAAVREAAERRKDRR